MAKIGTLQTLDPIGAVPLVYVLVRSMTRRAVENLLLVQKIRERDERNSRESSKIHCATNLNKTSMS